MSLRFESKTSAYSNKFLTEKITWILLVEELPRSLEKQKQKEPSCEMLLTQAS